MSVQSLIGRERELRALEDLVEHADERGGALVLRGEAGIGKSSLLQEASRRATDRGTLILKTTGVQSEAHLPFASLHQLLQPLLVDVHQLPAPQRAALEAAFGLDDTAAPDLFLIALATLELLGEAAARSPLLLVAEDAHWLDEPTTDVLAFVARRVNLEPIVLLLAVREGAENPFESADLPELRLDGLDDTSAGELLDAHAPDLTVDLRRRLLDDAGGNPLALVELPLAIRSEDVDVAIASAPLPITDRLERAFAGRVSELPAATRTLLLAAALDEGADVREILDTAHAVDDRVTAVDQLGPAEACRLVFVDGDELRFRHPLVRAAIYQDAATSSKQAVHSALAEVHAADTDRSVWHKAASLSGPDDQVASDLEAAARRALGRGAPPVAAAALERSAQLTADPASRGSLLLRAADMQFELGRNRACVRLLAEAKRLELGQQDRMRLSFFVEMFEEGSWSGSTRVPSFVAMANEMTSAGEPDRALHTLLLVALRCWWGNPEQETRDLVVSAAERIPVAEDTPALLAVLAHADPVQQGATVLERISRLTPEVRNDPAELFLIGAAASSVWSHDVALGFLATAVDGLRAQGRLGLLAQALVTQAWAAVHLAKETLALTAAEEATTLAHETGQSRWAVAAQLARAAILAERGDAPAAEALAREAEAILLPMGANPMLALVQFVRGRGAVAHQRYDDGLDHLSRMFDRADVAYHPFVGAWALADLVEASAQSGKAESAARYIGELESLAAATSGTLLQVQLGYARPLLAGDADAEAEAEALYQAGLSSDLANWPCYRGRLLLSYGTWLRRRRRVAESRAPLRAARETFDALRFHAVAERARQELRASGETSRSRTPEARDQLTPQELQIVQMAAQGLTNREIGQKLYLSHRTVGSHLYRVFPKLGVSSRAELGSVLSAT